MNTPLARLFQAALCAAAIAAAANSHAQLTLTNSPAWNGSDNVFPFGEPEVATFGQVFTADATNTLMDGFTFHLRSKDGGDVQFRGFVAAWDGTRPTGSTLFESGQQVLPANTNLFQDFSFDTSGLPLTPGAQYVAFISASLDFDSIAGTAAAGITASQDTYLGGNMVIASNGSDFDSLFVDPWYELTGMDLAFEMNFSGEGGGAVPESSAFGLIGTAALLGLSVFRVLRRR